jgi:hypothetical protein
MLDVRDLAAKPMTLVERALIALNAGAEPICRKTRQRRGAKGGARIRALEASRRPSIFATRGPWLITTAVGVLLGLGLSKLFS